MPRFDAKKQVTNELKFKPDPEVNDGLCLGKLLSVEVSWSDKENNKSEGEYGGMSLPQIKYRFKQVTGDTGDAPRFYVHRERIINSLTKEGDDVADKTLESLYQSMFDRMMHINERCSGTEPSQAELNKVTPDESATPEKRVEQFGKFFDYFAALLNEANSGKPSYKGKTYVMKLVADYTSRKYYTFPTFVGEGFIEEARFNKANKLVTTIELKHNETIELGSSKPKADELNSDMDLPDDVKNIIGG